MYSTTAVIELSRPRRFTTRALFALHVYNVLLVLPIFLSVLALSLLKLGWLTLLLPLLALAATAWFLPFGLGNSYVARLVRSMPPEKVTPGEAFIVQLTVYPRLRSGLRALVEDADDVGLLTFTASEIIFHGDSVRLRLPFKNIEQSRLQNVGPRGRFIYGRRIELLVTGLPNVEAVEFAERSSRLLPTSRRLTNLICERLNSRIKAA